MKGMRIFVALWTLALAACGSGGIQSPDFTSQLVGLEIRDSQNQVVPAAGLSAPTGSDIQLKAVGTYSNGPSAPTATSKFDVKAEWESDEPAVATVESRSGLVTPVAAGTTTITAKSGDRTTSITFIVTGPPPSPGDITGLAITRVGGTATLTSDTIPIGGQRSYAAFATFRDGTKTPVAVAVNWTSANSLVAAPQVPPNNPSVTKPFAVPNEAAVGQTTTITATLPASPALGTTQPFAANVDITVSNATFASLDAIILTPASPVIVGTSVQATARGTFIDNGVADTTLQIPNFNLVWASSNNAVAEPNTFGTIATKTAGSVTITGTLKAGVFPAVTNVTQRFASTTLVVNTAGGNGGGPGSGICSTAFLAPTATVSVPPADLLCVGCSVTSADRVINNVDGDFATVNITLGLLGLSGDLVGSSLGGLIGENGATGGLLGLDLSGLLGLGDLGLLGLNLPINLNLASQSIVVASPTVYPAGSNAAFVIGFPVNDLLSLELLNQFEVTTFNGTVAQETATVGNGLLTLELLGNALLPGAASGQQAVIGLTTTKPFTTLRFTYYAGPATALSSLQVFNACANIPTELLGTTIGTVGQDNNGLLDGLLGDGGLLGGGLLGLGGLLGGGTGGGSILDQLLNGGIIGGIGVEI